MYEPPAYKTFTIQNEPKHRQVMAPSITEVNGPYVCPLCHNADHPPGARFCYICGMGFPLSRQPKNEN